MKRTLALVIAGLFLMSGCTVWRPIPFAKHETPALPKELAALYEYPKGEYPATITREEDRKKYLFRQVEIPFYLPKELEIKPRQEWENEVIEIKKTNEKEARDRSLHYTNRIDLYLPKKSGPRPLIIISPIMGGNMVVDWFAKYFAQKGYVAVIVHRKKSFYDETDGVDQVERYLRTSIIRLRQAIDWLETQPEVDPKKIGGFGISYGAVLHSVLAAVEPRIRFHILAMPGGPLSDVIIDCPDPGVKKLVVKMQKLGWSKDKIYKSLKETIKTDPIYFAPYVPKDRIMMMAALFDRVVGSSHSFRLWNAMGRPKLKVIPLGHYGGVLIYPYLRMVSYHYFKSRF